ncbi:MAG: sigma 54-interacting transcriptional regulator [Deltaproteobacteria bacterium]|nr:sigma 54-interacting transcriptional regulator [Deltaproteobacteria bacterium]
MLKPNSYHHYDEQAGTIIVLASASPEGGQTTFETISLPPEIHHLVKGDGVAYVELINRPKDHPVFKHIANHSFAVRLSLTNGSMILLRLFIDGRRIGAITFCSEQRDQFNQDDLDLLSTMRRPVSIALANSLRYRELLESKQQLDDDNRFLREELYMVGEKVVVGLDFGLKEVMQRVHRVAHLSSPVLLLGDTGTGKEVIASAIHNLSPRKHQPFIKVNCGAIPESLIDSELFGHEKGAFTGALEQKKGRFERADKGTLFLDEIGELSLGAQVRLLRVLQEQVIERVGGTKPIKLDIRIIAATHRRLEEMVDQRLFRQDLYFRLQVFPIYIPRLKERREDIPALVYYFIQRKSREMGLSAIPTVEPDAIRQLVEYDWPGNVRELENIVERALIMSRGTALSFDDQHLPVSFEKTPLTPASLPPVSKNLELDGAIARHIRHVLEISNGKIAGRNGAADLMGIHPATLRHRMKKLGIPFGRKPKE